MTGLAAELHRLIDLLEDKQVEVLYNVAVSFAAQTDPGYAARVDFDYISPEESEAIERAFEEIRRGECMTYVPDDELTSFLEESMPNTPIHVHIGHTGVHMGKNVAGTGERAKTFRVKRKLAGSGSP